jgi:hypothetical protein
MRLRILRPAIVFVLSLTASGQVHSERLHEQSAFGLGAEGPVVQHPVSISTAELVALSQDDMMRHELERDPSIQEVTGEGLEAAVIHLGRDKERDLLIVGSGSPFAGANVGPFWIIRDLPAGPRVIFRAIALQLMIDKTTSKGLRDVEAPAVVRGSVATNRTALPEANIA